MRRLAKIAQRADFPMPPPLKTMHYRVNGMWQDDFLVWWNLSTIRWNHSTVR